MKTIITNINHLSIISLSILIVALLTFSSFTPNEKVVGKGEITTTKRQVKSFSGIKCSEGINVYLTQEDNIKVTVETYENLQDIIKTEVKDGVLIIYSDNSFSTKKSPNVHVSFKDIIFLKASSGSDIENIGTLNLDKIKIIASSGSDISLNIKSNKIIANVSSGADIKLIGSANFIKITASSGADFKGKEFTAKNCKAYASSSADITLVVTDRIIARASSSADIKYFGNAIAEKINTSSGGSISNHNKTLHNTDNHKPNKKSYIINPPKGWVLVQNKDGLYGFIDSNGEEIVKPKYLKISRFGEIKQGWALVQNEDGLYGFINNDGDEIVEPQYLSIPKGKN